MLEIAVDGRDLTTKQLASHWGCAGGTVQTLANRGLITYYRVRGKGPIGESIGEFRFPISAVEEFDRLYEWYTSGGKRRWRSRPVPLFPAATAEPTISLADLSVKAHRLAEELKATLDQMNARLNLAQAARS